MAGVITPDFAQRVSVALETSNNLQASVEPIESSCGMARALHIVQ
jgi:hypothetical protein